MSFAEWAEFKMKKNSDKISKYNPADYSTSYYKKSDIEDSSILTPFEKAKEILNNLRNPYLNQPTMGEIEKALSACINEITSLRSDVRKLSLELEEGNDNIISIHVGDETVIIDGDLASTIYKQAVSKYIVTALETYIAFSDFSENFIKESSNTLD